MWQSSDQVGIKMGSGDIIGLWCRVLGGLFGADCVAEIFLHPHKKKEK